MMKKDKKRKFYPTAAVLLGFVGVMTAVDVFTPVKAFSEMENRDLRTESRLSVSRLISGDFQKDYETMVSDQFAGRDGWITAKSVSESALQKTENNGVLYGKNGAFFGKFTSYDETQLERNLYFLENFANDGHPLTFAIVPSAYEYAEDQLPLGAGQVDQRPVIAGVKETLSDNENITWFDADAVLTAQQSEDLFYRTDHHWKGETAYLVYAALCEQMGLTPASADELVLREVEGFYGSYYSKCKKAGTEPDTLSFYDQPFKIHTEVLNVNMEMEEKDNWYNEEQLSARDKYGALLWGNYGLTVLAKEEVPEDPKRLLLIKDSFSNCLAPLFLSNFDEVYIVDLRSYPSGLNELCDEKDFDETLVLYNFENLESDTNFYRMTY